MNYSEPDLKIFLRYIEKHKGLFAIDMVCAILVAVIDLVFPYVSRQAMNSLLPRKLYAAFFAVMGILILAYVGRGVLYYIITVLGHKMGVLTEADMRRDLFEHMQGLSFSFYDHNRTGVLLSRVVSDLFEVTELAHHGLENVLICTLSILGGPNPVRHMALRRAGVPPIAWPSRPARGQGSAAAGPDGEE